MISKDVLALVQLDPPGIELCRVSNMKREAEDGHGGDGGATNTRGSPNDGPRMDKLCTLLLPPLQYGNHRTVLAPAFGHSALGTFRVIKYSPAGRGQSIAMHHWGATKCSAGRQKTASLALSCISRDRGLAPLK
jgi:hypothetical protein